jgi:hypothetical protein
MFTKNKILLGLALALFTFAAPNRAQAQFFFADCVDSVTNPCQGIAGWNPGGFFFPHFGQVYTSAAVAPYYWYYKNDFGWLSWKGNNSTYPSWIPGGGYPLGSFFYDYRTGDTFYTNYQLYVWSGGPHYFYSYNLGAWLWYYEPIGENANLDKTHRLFYDYATGQNIYYP